MPKKVQLVGDKNTAGEPIISTDQTSVYYNNKLIAVEGSKVATGYLGSIGYTRSIGSILTTHGQNPPKDDPNKKVYIEGKLVTLEGSADTDGETRLGGTGDLYIGV